MPLLAVGLSPLLLPDTVTFAAATYLTGARGGVTPSYAAAARMAAYVEQDMAPVRRGERQDERPIATGDYRIFTATDPSTGLGRPLTTDDRITWNTTGFVLQVKGPAIPQGTLWLTQATRVS